MPNLLPTNKSKPNLKINLLEPANAQGGSNKFLDWVINAGRYLLIGTELLLFLAFASRFYYDDRIQDTIETGIEPKVRAIVDSKENEKKIRALQSKLTYLETIEQANISHANVVTELTTIAPEGVMLETIKFDTAGLTFSGTITSIDQLEIFKKRFTKSAIFQSLDISSLTSNKETGTLAFTGATQIKRQGKEVTQATEVPQ